MDHRKVITVARMRSPSPSASSPPHPCSRTTQQTLIPNPKQTQNVKQTQSKPKKIKKQRSVWWFRREWRRGGRRAERKREEERIDRKIYVFRSDLSLYSGHRSCREWVLAKSIKPKHVHRRRFDSFGRILPDLSNRRKYNDVGLTDLAENRREIPPRVPFPPTVQIPSTSVFNHRPERGRRMTKSSKREMVFFGERKKNDGFVLKRKKQEKKMLRTVSKKIVSKFRDGF
jgi:hypothetical protein